MHDHHNHKKHTNSEPRSAQRFDMGASAIASAILLARGVAGGNHSAITEGLHQGSDVAGNGLRLSATNETRSKRQKRVARATAGMILQLSAIWHGLHSAAEISHDKQKSDTADIVVVSIAAGIAIETKRRYHQHREVVRTMQDGHEKDTHLDSHQHSAIEMMTSPINVLATAAAMKYPSADSVGSLGISLALIFGNAKNASHAVRNLLCDSESSRNTETLGSAD